MDKCHLIGEPIPATKCTGKTKYTNIVESSLGEKEKEFELFHEKIKQDEEKIRSLITKKEKISKLLEEEQKKKELVEKISDSLRLKMTI